MVCEAATKPQQAAVEAIFPSMKAGEPQQAILHFNWDQRQAAKAAMQTLVQALAEDPVNSYFSGKKRRRFVKDEVKGYLKALPGAANFIATQDSQAVALWQLMPHETPRNELLAGWTRILKVPPRLWRQLLRLELHYEKAHTQVAAEVGSYYYLSFIGTAPEARGKGYGSLLLRCITDQADQEGRWCLLEATSERSEALYARHGFVTYQAYRVSPKAPPVFLMKRAPAGATADTVKGTSPVALSAAALGLVAALSGKAAAGPGSDCGSTASSNLISASVLIDECEGQQQGRLKLDVEEAAESEEADSMAGEQGKSSTALGVVDAGVIVSSIGGAVSSKELSMEASSEGSKCDSNQQHIVLSSSSAGAGGPNAVGC